LDDRDIEIRESAIHALGEMEAGASSAVVPLIRLLKAKEPKVRRAAAEALGNIGPAAKPAVPALAEAIKDHADADSLGLDVSFYAYQSLQKLGPDAVAAVPALLDSLTGK